MNNSTSDIRWLDREEINIVKWDQRIITAPNGLIYARSFYLDAMAENWSALVAGDYEYVMPLTWNRKYGFSYLYQPYFANALGVFGPNDQPFEVSSFLKKIPKKYSYWDIDLNENNIIPNLDFNSHYYTRINYFLGLKDDYEKIKTGYKRLATRMNKKATESNLEIFRDRQAAEIIRLYQIHYAKKHPSISERVWERLKRCMEIAFQNNLGDTYVASSPAGEPIAFYIMLKDQKFIYSLLGGSTQEGKKLGAFYFLTDAIIRDHASSGKIFRFEGSDMSGISFFNSMFGPEKTKYIHLKMNKLPFPFRLFK